RVEHGSANMGLGRQRAMFGAVAAMLTVAAASSLAGPAAGAAPAPISQNRSTDPVVIQGSLVGSLNGVPVGDIVAFRWVNGWSQIPVQVDQRKTVELNTVYGKPANTSN